MEITEVRVKLVSDGDERLKAFCSMTLDNEFVIRDIKVVEGRNGHFVAMPSRKLTDHCKDCGSKNNLRAKYCSNCGKKLPVDRVKQDDKGRMKLHADIAHPINAECRKRIQETVIAAFEKETGNSKPSGYKPAEGTDEPLVEDIDEPLAEDTDEPLAEGTDEPLAEDTDEPLAEDTDEPLAEDTDEPLAEDTDEPPVKDTDEPSAEDTDEPDEDVPDVIS